MKIAIGYEVIDGPWGGGNRFVSSLTEALIAGGAKVSFSLKAPDIDLILIIDPRKHHLNIPFGPGDALRYKIFRNPSTIIVHRINECDERKNTKTMNYFQRLANYSADHTVFVASWLKELDVWQKSLGRDNTVILNGADTNIFMPNRKIIWDKNKPMKIVTHHWGGNWMKGFDIYEKLDGMLKDVSWQKKIEFTYIGNLPKGFSFKNSRYIKPLNGLELADELSKNHVYLTGSINEPGGNHQNEGALCGLPLVYRNSGCMPEYCIGFGCSFDGTENFESAIQKMFAKYSHFKAKMDNFPHTSVATSKYYIELFEELILQSNKDSKSLNILKKPFSLIMNQLLM